MHYAEPLKRRRKTTARKRNRSWTESWAKILTTSASGHRESTDQVSWFVWIVTDWFIQHELELELECNSWKTVGVQRTVGAHLNCIDFYVTRALIQWVKVSDWLLATKPYFKSGRPRLHAVKKTIVEEPSVNGKWNCRPWLSESRK